MRRKPKLPSENETSRRLHELAGGAPLSWPEDHSKTAPDTSATDQLRDDALVAQVRAAQNPQAFPT